MGRGCVYTPQTGHCSLGGGVGSVFSRHPNPGHPNPGRIEAAPGAPGQAVEL